MLGRIQQFKRSIWLFPVLLALGLFMLSALRINGSSMGMYYGFFYGPSKDPALIANHPQPIRSDEWLTASQIVIGQKNSDYARTNQNIGNGEDVSVILDAPYKEWSILFKPHELGFFVMPFDNAFAFRWWSMGYLLILSAYFFVLSLLPGRRLLAALLGLGMFFNPFVQWWYINGTLGTITYSLLGAVVFVQLLRQTRWQLQLLWGLGLAYVAVCFALILYPPFQIACALAVLAFAVGHLIERWQTLSRSEVRQAMIVTSSALLVAGIIIFAFLHSRADVVDTIKNTAYPGNRTQPSGGYSISHLFSGQLDAQLQNRERADHYLTGGHPLNQSEASSFLLLLPFLFVPSVFLIYKRYRKEHELDWPMMTVNAAFVWLLAWLFVPHLDFLGRLTLLNRVPHQRLMLGLGVLNLIALVLFVRRYALFKGYDFRYPWALGYVIVIFAFELLIGLRIMHHSPGFIGVERIIAFSLPIPIIVYLLFRKKFEWAAAGTLLFMGFMTYQVNPLYRGTDVLQKTQVSNAIRSISLNDHSAWATEGLLYENLALMEGAHSLSATYAYPQLSLWKGVDPNAEESTYNRYAHFDFNFDRDANPSTPSKMTLLQPDLISLSTEPCGDFLRQHNAHYLLTESPLNSGDSCASLVKKIDYPATTFFIYHTR